MKPRGIPGRKPVIIAPQIFSTLERGEKLEALTDKALDDLRETLEMTPDKADEDYRFERKRKDDAVRLILTTQRQVDGEKLAARMTDKLGDILDRLNRKEPKDITPSLPSGNPSPATAD